MFTSRSEHRLRCRADNADMRLTPLARSVGLVHDDQWNSFLNKKEALQKCLRVLQETCHTPHEWRAMGLPCSFDGTKRSAANMLGAQYVSLKQLMLSMPGLKQELQAAAESCGAADTAMLATVENECVYTNYVKREDKEAAGLLRNMDAVLPKDFEYQGLGWASIEERALLMKHKPRSIRHAAELPGMRASTLTQLLHLVSHRHQHTSEVDKMEARQ